MNVIWACHVNGDLVLGIYQLGVYSQANRLVYCCTSCTISALIQPAYVQDGATNAGAAWGVGLFVHAQYAEKHRAPRGTCNVRPALHRCSVQLT